MTDIHFQHIETPLSEEAVRDLKCGDCVLLSGTVYTARDAAHKRLYEALEQDAPLPFDLRGQTIYYAGPAPASPGHVIGPAGPTSSYRMDSYTPRLLDHGLKCMIGKGRRSQDVISSMQKNGAVYLGAVGGAAALISKSIVSCQLVAYEDLGTEAVYRLEVRDMPLFVLIDCEGNNLYEQGPKEALSMFSKELSCE